MTSRSGFAAIDPKTADLAAADHAARRMRSEAIRSLVLRLFAGRGA